VRDGVSSGFATIFQHLLDHINAATGTVSFIAAQHIGWAGGGAKSTMDAGSQNAIGIGQMRVLKLRWGEVGLHDQMLG
jgi:hypothetical protein